MGRREREMGRGENERGGRNGVSGRERVRRGGEGKVD